MSKNHFELVRFCGGIWSLEIVNLYKNSSLLRTSKF